MYIGKTPTVGNFQVCDAISVVNGQAAYTLQVGGTNVAPESANHMLVSLNGILQKPGSSFTISGSTMTFASNLATGDVIDFVQILGNVLDIGQPSDDTVTAAKLNNNIISGQTELASEPADTDEFLVSDAGTLKRIDYSLIKAANTPAFFVELNASQTSISDDSFTKVTFNNESFDTNNAFDPSTNYRFTTPSDGAGKYVFFAQVDVDSEGNSNLDNSTLQFKKNNSVIRSQEYNHLSNPPRNHVVFSTILESMSANDYMEIFVRIEATDASGGRFNGTNTWFGGYKIIE